MVSRATVVLAAAAIVSVCCAHPKPADRSGSTAAEDLASADRLATEGCLDCLIEAYHRYEAVRQRSDAAPAALTAAIRTAALIGIRQRQLGMVDDGYFVEARRLVETAAGDTGALRTELDAAESLPDGVPAMSRPASSDEELERAVRLRRNRDTWVTALGDADPSDLLAAFVTRTLECNDRRPDRPAEASEPGERQAGDPPLLQFVGATCRSLDRAALEGLRRDHRFVENSYLLGASEVAALRLDEAAADFETAYAWRPRWPSLTTSMANVAMTAEDFERAEALYRATLDAAPRSPEALIGWARALTYLGRHDDAIRAADRLLAERWNRGDALYWKALNEADLGDYNRAWTDVEAAAALLVNADVPKLAGTIAYRRNQLQAARERFEIARPRNPSDCEIGFDLGTVLAELKEWPQSADVLVDTTGCLERAEAALQREIAELDASSAPSPRRERQIARRQQQLTAVRRMRATSIFNVAVAYYTLSRREEARAFAARVADDEQFGERAREILARLKE